MPSVLHGIAATRRYAAVTTIPSDWRGEVAETLLRGSAISRRHAAGCRERGGRVTGAPVTHAAVLH